MASQEYALLDIRSNAWLRRYDTIADVMGLKGTPFTFEVSPVMEAFAMAEVEEFDTKTNDSFKKIHQREHHRQALRALIADPLFGILYFGSHTAPQIKQMAEHVSRKHEYILEMKDKVTRGAREKSAEQEGQLQSILEDSERAQKRWKQLEQEMISHQPQYAAYVQALAKEVAREDRNQILASPQRYHVKKQEVRDSILRNTLRNEEKGFLYLWDLTMLNRLRSLNAQDIEEALEEYADVKRQVDPRFLEKQMEVNVPATGIKMQVPGRFFYENILKNHPTYEEVSTIENIVQMYCKERLARVFAN